MLFELVAFMHWESIGSFKDESCLIGYVPQLNWNWRVQNRAFLEVVISAPKVGSINLHA